MSFVFFFIIFITNMSNNGDSHNQPMDEQPVIDDGLIVGLKPTKGTKPGSKGRHSWPTLEVVTMLEEKKKVQEGKEARKAAKEMVKEEERYEKKENIKLN
jgi:hypothetical protein